MDCQTDGRTDGRTDERTDAYVAFRVYYFVGGWSREVRSAILVADSISRVHAPLNAVVLRKEVVDFSLPLPLPLSLSLSLFLSLPPLSFLPFSGISLSLVLPTLSLPLSIQAFGPHGPRLSFLRRKESEKKDSEKKEDRILLRRDTMDNVIPYIYAYAVGRILAGSYKRITVSYPKRDTLSPSFSFFFSAKLARLNGDINCLISKNVIFPVIEDSFCHRNYFVTLYLS